jgi:hypothetical protein
MIFVSAQCDDVQSLALVKLQALINEIFGFARGWSPSLTPVDWEDYRNAYRRT